jgi:hypothetical protein
MKTEKFSFLGWVPVPHTCNPSYSGGRGQDQGSKPAQINRSRPYLKKTHQKTGGVAQGVGPECKPQYSQKKKKKKKVSGLTILKLYLRSLKLKSLML